MRVEVLVDTDDVEKILDAAERATDDISIIRWMAGPLKEWFGMETASRFGVEGDRRTGNWAPLSETTQRIREEQGHEGDGPINVRSGELFDYAVSSKVHSNGEFVEFVTPGDTEDPVVMEKFRVAQQGRPDNFIEGFGSTPARPVIGFDEGSDVEFILRSLGTHIVREIVAGV